MQKHHCMRFLFLDFMTWFPFFFHWPYLLKHWNMKIENMNIKYNTYDILSFMFMIKLSNMLNIIVCCNQQKIAIPSINIKRKQNNLISVFFRLQMIKKW